MTSEPPAKQQRSVPLSELQVQQNSTPEPPADQQRSVLAELEERPLTRECLLLL